MDAAVQCSFGAKRPAGNLPAWWFHSSIMRLGRPALLCGLVLAPVLLFAVAAPAQPAPKHILVLYWDDQDFEGNVLFERSLREALASVMQAPAEYYSEYLESNRFPGEHQSVFLRDYLRQKYKNRPIDVVVTNASAPLDFLLKNRQILFPHGPIVFAATDRPNDAQLTAEAGATGVVYVSSYRKTLDLALRLHPDTRRVFVVSGTPAGDKYFENSARTDLQGRGDKVEVTYLTDLTLDELRAQLSGLPAHSLVLYVWQRAKNAEGRLLQTQQVLASIAPFVHVPMYGMSFANIGLGIVGGDVWTMDGVVSSVSDLVARIASGERARDIPVEKAPSVPMFDWRQLQRWGINEAELPPESLIRFRELTMWQQYKWRIVVAMAVIVLQAVLIGGLLLQRHRSRMATAALVQTQGVLRESEQRFHNMADTAPVMIWVSGPDKLWTFVNKGWQTFTGQEIARHLGNGWREAVHLEDADRCWAIISSAFDARVPFQMECRIRHADGEYRSGLCTGVPRFQDDGVFAGYIGTFVDITELKRSQERALAGHKLESLGLVASGIAHDFNNLLGGILACTELALGEHAAGEPHEEELQRIRASASTGAEIVRELMIYGGKNSPTIEPVDCPLLISEMLQLLKVSISKKIVLTTDTGTGLPMVRGNRAQIRQLVMNLVINASEAIGSREGEIRVRSRGVTLSRHERPHFAANLPDGNYLEIDVADTGRGMTEANKLKIFDPFFSTKSAGRGLGLAVVQGVVRSHEGAINVESAPGRGTVFQVLLPVVAASPEPVAATNGPPANASGVEGATVLIIEDEDSLRTAVSKVLRNRGFKVIESADGNSAVDRFAAVASEIDVVLLDMTLPGKSGGEVLGDLRRIRSEVKVIATSAYPRDHVQRSLNGLQPDGFVQKPYQVGDLVALLHELSHGRASDFLRRGQANDPESIHQL